MASEYEAENTGTVIGADLGDKRGAGGVAPLPGGLDG
jgi:hypothetical protein